MLWGEVSKIDKILANLFKNKAQMYKMRTIKEK